MTSSDGLSHELSQFYEASTAACRERLLALLRSGRVDAGLLPDPEKFVEHGIHARRLASPPPA